MASTTNLDIEKLNSADYVSVDGINAALDKLDKLGVDYIVEQGTSGEWWYRKWRSGRAECGVDDKNFGNVDHKNEWGGMYTSSTNLSFGAYPVTFASRPFASISFNSNGTGTTHSSFVIYRSTADTSKSPSFGIADPNSGTVEGCHFGIYACGMVK